jgi:hypothetical protein
MTKLRGNLKHLQRQPTPHRCPGSGRSDYANCIAPGIVVMGGPNPMGASSLRKESGDRCCHKVPTTTWTVFQRRSSRSPCFRRRW